MTTYDPKSARAEEFINHEEILATLAWAEENKENRALVERLLSRAKDCRGLTHREACSEAREMISRMIGARE